VDFADMPKIPRGNKIPRIYHNKRGFSSNHTMNKSPSRMDMGLYLMGSYRGLIAGNLLKGQED
jgi:hypothetical protein